MDDSKRKIRIYNWVYVLAWLVVIYLTVPFARGITNYLRDSVLLLPSVIFLFVVCLLVISFLAYKKLNRNLITLVSLLLLCAAYACGLSYARSPEEKVHLFQYGLLAFFVFRALAVDSSGFTKYFLALLITIFFGWGDEVLQYYTPERFFDWWDVILNAYSGLLGLLVIFAFEKNNKQPYV